MRHTPMLLGILWGLFLCVIALSQISVPINAAGAYSGAVSGSSESAADKEIQMFEIVVAPGDSLWGIAAKYSGPQTDIRQSIYQIRRLNQLSAAIIYPGQTLKIPAAARR